MIIIEFVGNYNMVMKGGCYHGKKAKQSKQ